MAARKRLKEFSRRFFSCITRNVGAVFSRKAIALMDPGDRGFWM